MRINGPPITELSVPTLILWGREDRFLAAQPAQALCASMQNCSFEFIDATGHFLLDEQPDLVAARIGSYLDATNGIGAAGD